MSIDKDKKKRESVMNQVQQGIDFSKRELKKRIHGFSEGMRVVHYMYGSGKLIVAVDKENQFQRYLLELDSPVSLGAGERLNRAWVWPGHLSVEEKEEKLKTIKQTKKEIDNDREPESKTKKRRTRKKGEKRK